MTRHRSIGLRLHIGRHGVTYALTGRVQQEGRARDTRLTWGTLQGLPETEGPQDVISLLERVLLDLRRRHGGELGAVGGSGAPGGGGGRPPVRSGALEPADHPLDTL